jgi:hypothetical protein
MNTEPTAELSEIIQLLNAGADSEALKEFRKLHGLVNRFVCKTCGRTSLGVDVPGVCSCCGGAVRVRVVYQPDKEPELPKEFTVYHRAWTEDGIALQIRQTYGADGHLLNQTAKRFNPK